MSTKPLFALLLIACFCSACGVDEHACGDRTEIVRSRIEGARLDNLSCTLDDDCTMIDVSTGCQGACSEAVNTAGVVAVQAEIDEANTGLCADNQASGCGYATPGCVLMRAVCDAGSCGTAMP